MYSLILLIVTVVFPVAILAAVKFIYNYQWSATSSTMDLECYKTYVKVQDGVVTSFMLGASIPRQIRIAGHKCKILRHADYSGFSDRNFKLRADSEIIAIVKLYIDNGGYANMMLHEFITKMKPADAKTKWLSKL